MLRRSEEGRWQVEPRDLALTALLTLTTLATIAPATLHNHRASGERILISSQGGLTFYHANNPRAVGSYSAAEGFSGHPARLEQEARRMAEAERGRGLTRSEISQFFYEKGASYLLEHPMDGALLIGRKALHWIANAELATEYVVAMEREYTPTLWGFFVPFAVILALAVAGLLLAPRATPDLALLLAMVAVNLATLLAFYVVSRYRLAALPSLAVLAGLGVARLHAGMTAMPTRAPARRAAFVGFAVLVVSLLPSHDVLSNQIAAEHYNVGNVQFARGEYAAAAGFYERALERMDDEWTAHFNLGLAHARLEAWDPAIAAFERVVELAPDNPVATGALREARCAREPAPGCPLGLAQSSD
jgi:tetratricopeptide (TPR) repeat protein